MQNLEAKQKAEVAEKCGCSIQDINDVLGKYEWMKTAHAKLQQMHAKGEGIPKTLDDVAMTINPILFVSGCLSLGFYRNDFVFLCFKSR